MHLNILVWNLVERVWFSAIALVSSTWMLSDSPKQSGMLRGSWKAHFSETNCLQQQNHIFTQMFWQHYYEFLFIYAIFFYTNMILCDAFLNKFQLVIGSPKKTLFVGILMSSDASISLKFCKAMISRRYVGLASST